MIYELVICIALYDNGSCMGGRSNGIISPYHDKAQCEEALSKMRVETPPLTQSGRGAALAVAFCRPQAGAWNRELLRWELPQ